MSPVSPSRSPDSPQAASGYRRGPNGRAVLEAYSPQWYAWLRHHYAVGNSQRAKLMQHMGGFSRWGEWEEPTEWPPRQRRAQSSDD